MNEKYLDEQFVEHIISLLTKREQQESVSDIQFGYCFSILERLKNAIEYLNGHSCCPHTDHDLICFMVYSDMVKNGASSLLKEFHIAEQLQTQFFKNICMGAPLYLDQAVCPTDDQFFAYFRSLVFAHPYETSRPKFLCKQLNEKQYSPWVIVNHVSDLLDDEVIGVRFFSSIHNRILDLEFPFELMKSYVKSRFDQMKILTEDSLLIRQPCNFTMCEEVVCCSDVDCHLD